MSKKVKVEADAKQIVLNRLIEKGWVWNAHDVKSASGNKIKQNIFFERPPIPIKDLGRKRPDILLYDNKNNKPILKSYSKFLYDNRYGSTVPHLDKELFLSIQIPLISMEDQLKFKKDYKKIQNKVLNNEKRTAALKSNLDELLNTYILKG